MVCHSGMQPTNRKGTPFRSADNSPFSRHFTLVDLLCIFGGIVAQPNGNVKKKDGRRPSFFTLIGN